MHQARDIVMIAGVAEVPAKPVDLGPETVGLRIITTGLGRLCSTEAR